MPMANRNAEWLTLAIKVTVTIHLFAMMKSQKNNKVDYAVVYGEFMYQAGPRPYERRVVCKVEKTENQMAYMYTFIVTNVELYPEYLFKFYCKRCLMENFIKESKTGFDFASISSHTSLEEVCPFLGVLSQL